MSKFLSVDDLSSLDLHDVWDALVKAGAPVYEMEFFDGENWNRDCGASAISLDMHYLLMLGHDGNISILTVREAKSKGECLRFVQWGPDGPPDFVEE